MAVLTHPFEWAFLFLGIAAIFGLIYYGIFKILAPHRKGKSRKPKPLLLTSSPPTKAGTTGEKHNCYSLHWLFGGTRFCSAKAVRSYHAGQNREKSAQVYISSSPYQAPGAAHVHIPSGDPLAGRSTRIPPLRPPPPAAGLQQDRAPPVRPPRPVRVLWSDESLPTTPSPPQEVRCPQSYLNRTPGTIISLTSSISTIDLAPPDEVLHESVGGTDFPQWDEDDTTLVDKARWRVSIPPVSPLLPFPPNRHAVATTATKTSASLTLLSTGLPGSTSPNPDSASQQSSAAVGEQEPDFRERHYLPRLGNAEASRAANLFGITPRPGVVLDYESHNAAVNERTRQALMALGPARDFRFPPMPAAVPPIRLVARVDAGVDGVRITEFPTAL